MSRQAILAEIAELDVLLALTRDWVEAEPDDCAARLALASLEARRKQLEAEARRQPFPPCLLDFRHRFLPAATPVSCEDCEEDCP